MSLDGAIQHAIDEWITTKGGPGNGGPTLAHYIAASVEALYVRRSLLRPVSSVSRKWNDDGSLHCNHGDSTPCELSGHTTVILYEIPDAEGER